MFRRLLLFCCLLLGAVSVALAQHGFYVHDGFRVSVLNDADEPLIGAYIYVNDKAVAATDMLGLAVIPQDKLKIGDSISVSYLFTKGQSLVVDQDILIKGEYEFILDENHGTLHADAVTVKADIRSLYDRTVRRRSPYTGYALYNSHFTMNITNPEDSVPSQWIAGRLEGVLASQPTLGKMPQYQGVSAHALNPDPVVLDSLQRSGFHVGFVNGYPLEITTHDDTINLEQFLCLKSEMGNK